MHPYRRVSAYRIASKKVLDFGGGGGGGGRGDFFFNKK